MKRGFFLCFTFSLLAVALCAQPLTINMGSSLGTFTLGYDQIQLNASGGTGNYTWSLASGSLPTGLNIAPFPNSPAQIGLVGVASAVGNYNFSLTVHDGTSSVTQAFTAKITALTVKDPDLPDAFVNTAFTYALTPLNNTGPVTFTITSPALPSGLSLSPAGVLAGSVSSPGTYNIDYSISDGVDTVYRGNQLFVYAVNLTTAGVLPNVMPAVAYSTKLAASGGSGGYQFAMTGGNLPSGLSLARDGTVSGTTNGGPGPFWFSVTVTDSAHNSYQKIMSGDVLGSAMTQLQLTAEFDDPVVGNTYAGLQVPLCCGGVAPFTWTATGLPAGMSIRSGSGIVSNFVVPSAGEIWGVASTPGDYNVTVTATDSLGATSSLTFPMHVSVLTLAPYNLPAGTINSPYSTTFQIVGGSAPYSVLEVASQITNANFPEGIALNAAAAGSGNFTVSGTPVENGTFDPLFKITDGSGNTLFRSNFFVINNLAGGIAINPNTNLGSATTGKNYSNQLTACCVANYVWSAAPGSLPPGVTLSSSGVLSGTPTAEGVYTFVVKASDAAGVAAPGFRQFTINVTRLGYNNNLLPYGNVGAAYRTSLAATGGTGSLTWSLSFKFLPAGLNLAPNGTLSGTPTATGQYFFGLTVTDQNNHTATFFYFLNIYAPGAFPPVSFAIGPNFGTWHLGTTYAQLAANGGNGTYAWSLVSGTLPPGLALRTDTPAFFQSNAQAGLIGVATTPGTYNFTLSVISAGSTATQTLTMKFSKLDLQDVALPDAFVNTPFSFTFTPIANAGSVTYTVNSNSTNGAMPPGLSLSSSGVLSGAPTTPGTYFLSFNISDGVDSQGKGYTLYVYAVNLTTPGTLPNGTQNSVYSTNLTASGGAGGYKFTLQGGLPNGLSLSSSGTISGTITGGPGNYGFTITATDTGGSAYSKAMALDVVGSTASPMRITGYFFNDPVFGDQYGWAPSACCGGTAPFTWTVTGLPPGLTIEPNSNSFQQYRSTPGSVQIYGVPQQAGTFHPQLTVTDAIGATSSITVPMHVSVLDVERADGSCCGLPNGAINVLYSATFSVLGGTGPYSFTKTIDGELPYGLSINSNTLTVSGTPLENGSNFNGPEFLFADSAGNTLFRGEGISISGGASTIAINSNGYYGYILGTVVAGSQFSTQFSACCATSYVWSVAAGSTPPPGLSLSPSGQLSGTPTTPGTYTFLVDAADASNSANVGVKSFVLIVTPIAITTPSLPFGAVGVPYSASLTATGATGAVTWMQTFYQSSLLPPGLNLASNGTISGTPTSTGAYAITVQATDANGSYSIRNYTIDIFQTEVCSYAFPGSPANVGAGASSGFASLVTSFPICGFSAVVSNNPDWITITSGSTGTGSSSIGYSLAANNSGGPRTGSFTLLDSNGFAVATFVINQAAASCSALTLSPNQFTFGQGGGSGTVNFNTSPCNWSITSDQPWVVLTAASGANSSFSFTVQPNPPPSIARQATLNINNGELTVAITQTGLVCTYTITDGTAGFGVSRSFGSAGGSGSINVVAPAGCSWTATASQSFITVAGSGTGSGNGSVNYSVAASSSPQSGTISIAGLAYVINQQANAYTCSASSAGALIRPEGFSEKVADVVLSCSGQAPAGGLTGDVLISFNTGVTNHLLSTGQTDALLLEDDPPAANLSLGANVFRGVLSSVNGKAAILFPAVPLASSNGGAFSHTWRITNARVNAQGLATGNPVQATVTISSTAAFNIASRPTVATLSSASTFSPAAPTAGSGQTTQPVSFTEGFASAFAAKVASGQDASQAGTTYNAESGYVNSTVLGTQTGFANSGTRLIVAIASVPSGVSVYAPVAPASGANAHLVLADPNGAGGFPVPGTTQFNGIFYQQIALNGGAGTATWEVTASDPAKIETLTFNLLLVNSGGAGLGGITYAGALAPVSSGVAPQLPSTSLSVPRFASSTVIATQPSSVTLSLAPKATTAQGQSAQSASLKPALRAEALTIEGTVSWTQVQTNTGSAKASIAPNVSVIGTLPPSWVITGCTAMDSAGVCPAIDPNNLTNSYTVAYPSLSPGQTGTIVLTAQSTSQTSGVVEYTSSIDSDFANTDSTAGSFTTNFPVSSANTQGPPPTGITVTLRNPTDFVQGQTGATYTATVNNGGSIPTSGPMTLTDTLPPGLTLTSMAGQGWICTVGTASCTRGDSLGGNSSFPSITITVDVASNAPSSVTNQVLAVVDGVQAPATDPTHILAQTTAPATFFNGQVSLNGGVYYLQFPNGNVFGYYNLQSFPIFYHYDLGFEAFVDGGNGSAYMFDFTSGHWFYTSSSLFPYLYDFTLNNWLYCFPATNNPGHYMSNPRDFSDLTTGKIISM